MELSFTPRDIKEIEDVFRKPLTDIVGDYSMRMLELFVRKGMKVDEVQAENAIEAYLKEGNDLMALYILILERLQGQGFLPKVLDIGMLKKKLESPVEFNEVLGQTE